MTDPTQDHKSAVVTQADRFTPALHEGGRFREWATVDLSAQCLSQAREQLDPEFTQFMTAVAERLTTERATEAAGKTHPDDIAVGRFAAAMKVKMAVSRAKGRGGWDDPEQCSIKHLQQLFAEHLRKGDPVDVANFCMMLAYYGASVTAPAPQAPTDAAAMREALELSLAKRSVPTMDSVWSAAFNAALDMVRRDVLDALPITLAAPLADEGRVVSDDECRRIAAAIYGEVADEPLGDLFQRRESFQQQWFDAVRAALKDTPHAG